MERDFTFINDIVSGFISAIDNDYDYEKPIKPNSKIILSEKKTKKCCIIS